MLKRLSPVCPFFYAVNNTRRGNGSGGKQVAEKYISVYKNPKTNQWERPIVANMASGVYNTWEVKSIKVSVDNNE